MLILGDKRTKESTCVNLLVLDGVIPWGLKIFVIKNVITVWTKVGLAFRMAKKQFSISADSSVVHSSQQLETDTLIWSLLSGGVVLCVIYSWHCTITTRYPKHAGEGI